MIKSQNAETSPMMHHISCGSDGTLDRVLRLGLKPKGVPAIFIHAGAGFHSHQNEHVHLQACVAAAEMGMRFLKAGAPATEAIEAALRILEDKEITNAGYGSNLSIDGTVECDATIVDHLGRSGACGAVPSIRNPISLAKLILDTSNQPLSLRRVPPNLLVGEGARTFAEEHGMMTFANEYLVSKNARDRFIRWQDDLKRAETKVKDTRGNLGPGQGGAGCVPCQYDTSTPVEAQRTFPRDHTAAIMAGTWNEGQPDSPYVGTPVLESSTVSDSSGVPGYFRTPGSTGATAGRSPLRGSPERTPLSRVGSPGSNRSPSPSASRTRNIGKRADLVSQGAGRSSTSDVRETRICEDSHEAHRDGSASPPRSFRISKSVADRPRKSQQDGAAGYRGAKRSFSADTIDDPPSEAKRQFFPPKHENDDLITDTIGAIAIDEKGQIAAGSSSGGIGMKHRGRLGPAALVGIGTAVVPCDDEDEDRVSVAAVTSGTGEHMATTMASQRCAERIYHGTRRGPGGTHVQEDDEDAILDSFITNDFMNHPGVKNCHSAGAIGVMVVKKTLKGYYFYFAHNTDSFALASMGGSEKQPVCTMSRLSEGAQIARGGRKIRLD